MKQRATTFLLTVLAVSGVALATEPGPPQPVAPLATAPTVDGVFERGEWDDAMTIDLDGVKSLRLKHDSENLYLAVDGDGGNIYVLKGDSIVILHASFSLGSARYHRRDGQRWDCVQEYAWSLHGLQAESDEVVRTEISSFLAANGWVASLMPMGASCQTEFAISLAWLGLEAGGEASRSGTPPIFVSSFQNLPPEERKAATHDLHFRWPVQATPIGEINRGYTPQEIDLDPTSWQPVFIGDDEAAHGEQDR